MKNQKMVWLLVLLILVICTGCDPQTSPAYQTTDGVALGENLNCPDLAAFGSIDEISPASNSILSSPILFSWHYAAPGPLPLDWSTTCVPTSFTLYLSPGPDYSTVLSFPVSPFSVDSSSSAYLLSYSFQLTASLQPHTHYRWIIVGHADGINIDQDQLALFQDPSAWQPALNSSFSLMSGVFQTGPICDSQTYSQINLHSPQDGTILDNDTPYFSWDMPNCSSPSYQLLLGTDPTMGTYDVGWLHKQQGFLLHSGLMQPCTTYYWQVIAGSGGNWIASTSSEIRSVYFDSGDCMGLQNPVDPVLEIQIDTPTPTPQQRLSPTSTPEACSQYQDQQSCELHKQCIWDTSTRSGSCKNK